MGIDILNCFGPHHPLAIAPNCPNLLGSKNIQTRTTDKTINIYALVGFVRSPA